MSEEKKINVEDYKFEPIKGYPMLYWKGKRPFVSTQFYPAQLKESYGSTEDNWINKIFWGDNLQVMSHLLKEFRGKVKLIYIDPPFDSKADYKKKIKLRGKEVLNDNLSFEEKQYTDIWTNDEYLQFMYERLVLMRELLSENGCICLHCDWHKSHYLRIILDEIFGPNNFLNEVIWKTQTSSGMKALANRFGQNHDVIYIYKKSDTYDFNKQFLPLDQGYIDKIFTMKDEKGKFKTAELQEPSKETILKLKNEGKLYETSGGKIRYKMYASEFSGILVDDVWLDFMSLSSNSKERSNYPTQKPEELIKRMVNTFTNEGDLVFDCFMGSGTTQAVAMKLGRKFIGADINLGAVQTTTKRLLKIGEELKDSENKYLGFEVYNVNNYDFFRNEVEAKELLISALEIQKLDRNTIFDGEKDGWMVKIMPVNRIATKADLSPLIANLDYKNYQKMKDENPSQIVEKIMIVCMGHEPDLKVTLENELREYKIKIEIRDILRDKSELELKRDSEIKVKVENNKLIVENFYPMNLLQKLSIQKQDVNEWKELVDSIMIDWNYDGAIFEPKMVDIPDKNGFVQGEYEIPEDAGTIKIKVTDLLSESLEWEVQNG